MKKMLIFLLLVGILVLGTAIVKELMEHDFQEYADFSNGENWGDGGGDILPCGGGNGNGGGAPG